MPRWARGKKDAVKRHKYGAVPTVVDGVRFASKAEAQRYRELKLLVKAGEIRDLRLQPEFALCCPDHHWDDRYGMTGSPVIGKYRADFAYWDTQARTYVVEDVKGFRTPLYRWKKKHVEAQYGFSVREVTS